MYLQAKIKISRQMTRFIFTSAVWRDFSWLIGSKHNIAKNHRRERVVEKGRSKIVGLWLVVKLGFWAWMAEWGLTGARNCSGVVSSYYSAFSFPLVYQAVCFTSLLLEPAWFSSCSCSSTTALPPPRYKLLLTSSEFSDFFKKEIHTRHLPTRPSRWTHNYLPHSYVTDWPDFLF